tara:strand:+ start:151 stop:399 length:249 start_codon:yes stop_codon:yes gene_type:complete
MNLCHKHNLISESLNNKKKKFGIRVILPTTDPLKNIIGENWEKLHWYETEEERDSVFIKMDGRHGYYRDTDAPSQILEKISQ